ncbi:hypothetical protein FA13DRAFT_1731875 [Coprinellus micaceus]|uniref:Uncharacterized protein n=1 Tax=Coprinellus micaceus TaxID=71717 RepID=A0A4Y7TD94_COPMI|nr:hypothetical protein FA13DRAFT_1731875 [Coprinellus micaceus]
MAVTSMNSAFERIDTCFSSSFEPGTAVGSLTGSKSASMDGTVFGQPFTEDRVASMSVQRDSGVSGQDAGPTRSVGSRARPLIGRHFFALPDLIKSRWT